MGWAGADQYFVQSLLWTGALLPPRRAGPAHIRNFLSSPFFSPSIGYVNVDLKCNRSTEEPWKRFTCFEGFGMTHRCAAESQRKANSLSKTIKRGQRERWPDCHGHFGRSVVDGTPGTALPSVGHGRRGKRPPETVRARAQAKGRPISVP